MTGDISVGREAPDFGVAASLGISGRCQAVNPVSHELPATAIHVTYPNQARLSHLFV